jgi:hypothetical protein
MNARSAEIEARSRIMWGDSLESVLAFLEEHGFSDKDALEIIAGFQRERARGIRESAIKRILIGILLVLAPIGAYVWSVISGIVSAKLVGVAAFIGLVGLWRIVDGTWMLLRPQSTTGDVAHVEE